MTPRTIEEASLVPTWASVRQIPGSRSLQVRIGDDISHIALEAHPDRILAILARIHRAILELQHQSLFPPNHAQEDPP